MGFLSLYRQIPETVFQYGTPFSFQILAISNFLVKLHVKELLQQKKKFR
jgi:hypothetical protein